MGPLNRWLQGERASPLPVQNRSRQSSTRHHCPDTLQQQESPLGVEEGQHGKDGRSDQVQQQVGDRMLRENPDLGKDKRGENQHRTRYLNRLFQGFTDLRINRQGAAQKQSIRTVQ